MMLRFRATRLTRRYKEIFVDMMMVEELGLLPPEHGVNPAMNGAVTFAAFVVFGCVPLLASLLLKVTL